MSDNEGAWTMGFIAMVGASIGAIVKLIQSNGCRMKCHHCNGTVCCDTDCDEGRQPLEVVKQKSNPVPDTAV